jgi:PiT family inorganic phosphate transporter
MGVSLMVAVNWVFRRSSPWRVDQLFRVGQLLSSAAFSLGHGTNDAQKTMGIIAVLLYTGGYLGPEFHVPWWVIISAHVAIATGTLTGGWRVIHTMGMRLTDLRPMGGFCAETSGAAVLVGTALAGIPVSTTHTVAGAIMGVGSTRRLSAVKWGVAGRIVWAWVLTIPLSAAVAAGAYGLLAAVF